MAAWIHKSCTAAADFLDKRVLRNQRYVGYSVPMDEFSTVLGHRMDKRRKRCVWPAGTHIQASVLNDAPNDRPHLRLDRAQQLATFFLDEPLFQLWDENVWVIAAPQRAVVLSKKDLTQYEPRWVRL